MVYLTTCRPWLQIRHMNAQFEQFAKDIPPPGFSEDDHPGGALHDYPGSQGAAGAAQAAAAAAAGGSVAGAKAALAEPGALSTAAHQQTSVTGRLLKAPTMVFDGCLLSLKHLSFIAISCKHCQAAHASFSAI